MKALVIHNGELRLVENHPVPKLAAGEALVRPLRMGISGTDLEIGRGRLPFEGVLGHEFVGVVEKVANKPHQHLVGKRVVGSAECACGKCDMCRGGLPEHCRVGVMLGIRDRDGCFAEVLAIPVRNLLQVPDAVDDDHAVFAHSVAAAYQILRQLTVEGRPYVTVLGDGRLGLLCVQVMSQLNATVRCIGKHSEKLALCEKWNVKHRLLRDVGLRADQDIVVDCTGSTEGMVTAMKMVRPRGTIVLKSLIGMASGGASDEGVLDLSPLVIHEVRLIGSRSGPMSEAVSALAESKIDVLSLISRRMKLADGVEAMRTASRPDVINVLLEP